MRVLGCHLWILSGVCVPSLLQKGLLPYSLPQNPASSPLGGEGLLSYYSRAMFFWTWSYPGCPSLTLEHLGFSLSSEWHIELAGRVYSGNIQLHHCPGLAVGPSLHQPWRGRLVSNRRALPFWWQSPALWSSPAFCPTDISQAVTGKRFQWTLGLARDWPFSFYAIPPSDSLAAHA